MGNGRQPWTLLKSWAAMWTDASQCAFDWGGVCSLSSNGFVNKAVQKNLVGVGALHMHSKP
eukprot:5680305-Ditylum_brightwellii.AAC.1